MLRYYNIKFSEPNEMLIIKIIIFIKLLLLSLDF